MLGKRSFNEYEPPKLISLDSPMHNHFDMFLNAPSLKMLKQASNQSSQVPSPAPEPNDILRQDREEFNGLADFISDNKDDNQSFKFEDE